MANTIPVQGHSKNVQWAFLNASASGATELVAAAGGSRSKIRVLAVILTTTAENSVKFQSASTDLTPLFPFVALGGMVLPFNEYGWFECAAAEALNFNQSVATACAVHIAYTIVS